MRDELEHTPATAGAPTIGRLGQFMPGVRFEAVPGMGAGEGAAAAGAGDGGGDAAAGAAAALAAGEGAGAAADANANAAAPPAPAPATPAWEDPAFLDLVDNRATQLFEAQMAPLVPLLEQLLGPGGGDGAAGAAAAPGELNPWDPSFAGNMDARFQALEQRLGGMLERLAAPLAERQQQETIAEGEQRLKDMLADDVARNGDFPRAIDPQTGQPAAESKAEKLVMPLARMLFPDVAGRFGSTPRAAEIAMSQAAGLVREIVAEARASASNVEANRLATLAGANGDIPAGAVAVQTVGDIRARTLDEGLSAVSARHREALRGGA